MTNAWASVTSPSLDALSSDSSPPPSALWVVCHLALTLPRRLWDAYVAHLWYHQPNSWVGRVASTFRILAFVLVLPVVLLTLLDVTSYVIARTLGVVDDVKASTSDADSTADGRRVAVAIAAHVPSAFVSETPARGSEGLAPEDSVDARTDGDAGGDGDGHGCASETAVCARAQAETGGHGQTQTRIQTQTRSADRDTSDVSPPQAYYFAGEEHLRLAGEGVFSPAVSEPQSPLTPWHPFTEGDSRGSGQVSEEEGIVLRRRVQGAQEDEPIHT